MQTTIAETISVADTIIENVKTLSADMQEKVLEFIDSLDANKTSIWDKLDEHLKKVPQEQLAELPTDASEKIDHYLYRSPKK